MAGTVVYEDEWGAMLDYPEDDYVEIRWYDATEAMSKEMFQRWLEGFAGGVEQCGRSGILVDGVQFRMDPANMDAEWRDANIVPRYNAAGVKKFAFLMPAGMPAIGAEPAYEGPAAYPTAYFGTRAGARTWLAS
jgi:hypothetical protein